MASSYEVRAIRFIKQIFSYLDDCRTMDDYFNAVYRFNFDHSRKVRFAHGMTRIAFITSDYVIKLDYDPKNVKRWGGCEQEVKFYRMACEEGYGYLFAKIKPYYHRGRVFYIMPRVAGIGRSYNDADAYMTNEENAWCCDHELYDLHNENYGWKGKHIVIIDYGANDYRYQ
jgi:hypothetical protein